MTATGTHWPVLVLAAVPFVLGASSARHAHRAGARLAPSAAAVLLTCLALSVSLSTGLLLCLAAVIALAEAPGLSGLSHWSPSALRALVPVPPAVGAAGGVVAALLLASAAVHLVRVVRGARRASAAAASLPRLSGGMSIVHDDAAIAHTVPGRHRRIVVSTGMLKALSAAQRRALLAHEASHLRHHHHRYVQLGRLAAAANPLLRPVSRAIDLAVERWADESAAAEVGDRGTVARALAAAALASAAARPAPAGSLGGARTDVGRRVDFLLRPPARQRIAWALVAAGIVVCWAATLVAIDDIHGLMEMAEG
ncbi:M56 family metallopeptidase [Streptomyces sp. NBC_01198]|uniref:M56 family metallopeptidase n=1 Tax=Streptomyces sp. NBC_01198 TaxID=2903769 RepID=UPI002E124BB1|nr:M56 family metallopeptidase [Streptomyces sp. NBC_01198]